LGSSWGLCCTLLTGTTQLRVYYPEPASQLELVRIEFEVSDDLRVGKDTADTVLKSGRVLSVKSALCLLSE
jgi:hypothetical protein